VNHTHRLADPSTNKPDFALFRTLLWRKFVLAQLKRKGRTAMPAPKIVIGELSNEIDRFGRSAWWRSTGPIAFPAFQPGCRANQGGIQ
jgi:hypothetical protein